MKRFVVALAVLLAVYGLARADYVIIIYNLGVVRENPGGNGVPGMPGGMLGAFGGMGGAGMGGPMPGGAAGIGGGPMPGGMSGMPRPGGAAGIGGGPVPGGAAGFGGGPIPGGAAGFGGGAAGVARARRYGHRRYGHRRHRHRRHRHWRWRPCARRCGGLRRWRSRARRHERHAPRRRQRRRLAAPERFRRHASWRDGRHAPRRHERHAAPGGMSGMPPGGAMGMGGMGMAGFGGMGGFFPGGGVPEQNFTPLLAIAVVELKKWAPVPEPNPRQKSGIIHAFHKFSPKNGSYVLPITLDRKMTSSLLPCDTIQHRYLEQYNEHHPNGKATPDGLTLLAEWTLKHGLLDDFVKVMEELTKLDPKDPAAVAFDQVQKEMAKPITKGDASDAWRAKVLDGYKVEKSEHYALLHNLEVAKPADAVSRLKRLEDTYRSFYYWFALKGKVMPVPDQRLVAVLVKHGDEFKRQQQIFDSLPTVSDGFLARRDNLAVFSLERTDLASEALTRNTKSLWRSCSPTATPAW